MVLYCYPFIFTLHYFQAHFKPDLVYAWFLEIAFVQEVCVCVCMCVLCARARVCVCVCVCVFIAMYFLVMNPCLRDLLVFSSYNNSSKLTVV